MARRDRQARSLIRCRGVCAKRLLGAVVEAFVSNACSVLGTSTATTAVVGIADPGYQRDVGVASTFCAFRGGGALAAVQEFRSLSV
jgi:hypothetical protein